MFRTANKYCLSHETKVLKIFDFCAIYKIIIRRQKMQKKKNTGRPPKPLRDRESFGISAYFTHAEFLELQHIALRRQYKSLSKFVKDTLKIGLKGNKEIERSIEYERNSYRSYAAALSHEIDNILIQDQNLAIPLETQNSIKKMINTIDQLIARLNK